MFRLTLSVSSGSFSLRSCGTCTATPACQLEESVTQSSSFSGPKNLSFRALSGWLNFTVQRHKFNRDSLPARVRQSYTFPGRLRSTRPWGTTPAQERGLWDVARCSRRISATQEETCRGWSGAELMGYDPFRGKAGVEKFGACAQGCGVTKTSGTRWQDVESSGKSPK